MKLLTFIIKSAKEYFKIFSHKICTFLLPLSPLSPLRPFTFLEAKLQFIVHFYMHNYKEFKDEADQSEKVIIFLL